MPRITASQATTEDAAPVVHDGGDGGQDVEDGKQQSGQSDHVVERVLNRAGKEVDPGQPDDQYPDQYAGGNRSLEPAGDRCRRTSGSVR